MMLDLLNQVLTTRDARTARIVTEATVNAMRAAAPEAAGKDGETVLLAVADSIEKVMENWVR
jgi:hypothetical protein